MCSLKVIPVAIGSDANSNELEKVTTNRKNLVTSPKDEGPKSLGRKIMSAVIKGDFLLILTGLSGIPCKVRFEVLVVY